MLTIFIRIYLYISMHSYIGIMIRSKKSLGQHFLRNRGALEKIVAAAELVPTDTVLEVGPGEGVLTALLLERAGRVVAVEKDSHLIPVLQKRFAKEIASGKLELIHCDILDLEKIEPFPYKIVANIPYYITGQFLRKFLQSEMQPSMMIVAGPISPRLRGVNKESILSISVKCYGTPKYIGTVKAGSFSPTPKVDSAILKISGISKKFFADFAEERFFAVLKKGFAHPRKLLASNLGITPDMLEKCGVEKNARAEDVSLAQWGCLSLYYS